MSWNGVKKQTSIDIEAIEAWCEEMGIENYTINSKGEIDVDDDVDLDKTDFEELPYKFGTVDGWFTLSNNKKLKSLKNCPYHILNEHMFDIEGCSNLDSLEGFPKTVAGNVYCNKCKRKFTKEEIISICDVGGEINN